MWRSPREKTRLRGHPREKTRLRGQGLEVNPLEKTSLWGEGEMWRVSGVRIQGSVTGAFNLLHQDNLDSLSFWIYPSCAGTVCKRLSTLKSVPALKELNIYNSRRPITKANRKKNCFSVVDKKNFSIVIKGQNRLDQIDWICTLVSLFAGNIRGHAATNVIV